MAYLHVWWNFTTKQFVGKPVRATLAAANVYCAIAMSVQSLLPFPASGVCFNNSRKNIVLIVAEAKE